MDSSDDEMYSSDDDLVEKPGFEEYKSGVDGDPHPGKILESSTLRMVVAPKIIYQLTTPARGSGVSCLQYEAVARICQAHEKRLPGGERAGFLLGDGTGVGKGRQIAFAIKENVLRGRRVSVWISTSQDLKCEAECDLRAVRCDAEVVNLPTLFQMPPPSTRPYVIFGTYNNLVPRTKLKLQLHQIVNYLGGEKFEGLIIFDECHKAKNFKEGFDSRGAQCSRTGTAVVTLQMKLPNARILYVSATGATDLNHFSYMQRLGLWGKGRTFPTSLHFISEMQRRGVSSAELLAVELKTLGLYLSRHVGFEGVKFSQITVPMTAEFKRIYKLSSEIWLKLAEQLQNLRSSKRGSKSGNPNTTAATFYGLQQRYFAALCVASKVDLLVSKTREAVDKGMSVVIGLQHTGETSFKGAMYKESKIAKSSLWYMLTDAMKLVEVSLSVPDKSATDEPEHKRRKKVPAIQDIYHELRPLIPVTTLDQIIQQLGGQNEVAEMSGRDRSTKYPPGTDRKIKQLDNMGERQEFQKGRKRIAIISDAASIGISLHSEVPPGRGKQMPPGMPDAPGNPFCPYRRLHITVELAWSADKAIQQFGRTNRTNQVYPPEYLVLLSAATAENRFVFAVLERLRMMGAISNADRNASNFGMTAHFGLHREASLQAIRKLIKLANDDDVNTDAHLADPAHTKDLLIKLGLASEDETTGVAKLAKKNKIIQKVLNRLLMLELSDQEEIITALSLLEKEAVERMKKKEELDVGIKDLSPRYKGSARIASKKEYLYKGVKNDDRRVTLNSIKLDRGMGWEEVRSLRQIDQQPQFWINQLKSKVMMTLRSPTSSPKQKLLDTYFASTGLSGIRTLQYVASSGFKETADTQLVEKLWNLEYNQAATCIHQTRSGLCKLISCQHGSRVKKFVVISGCLTDVWPYLEAIIQKKLASAKFSFENGECLVGILIPLEHLNAVKKLLHDSFVPV